MLISTQMHLPFQAFLQYLMPICLINLAIMLFFFFGRLDFADQPEEKTKITLPEVRIKNRLELGWQLAILLGMIFLFMFSALPPGLLGLGGSLAIFALSSHKNEALAKFSANDIWFFFLLFILVGGVKAAGLTQSLTSVLSAISGGNSFIQCILLMWGACFLTMVLNAGPTAALFLPVFLGLGGTLSDNIIFWALSLGVCAGSSGTLVGATGGPVALTFLERYGTMKEAGGRQLVFKEYLHFGLPLAYLHLVTSTIYVAILFLVGK